MLFWRNRHEVREEELNAFVDGELRESARHRIERHIASCTPCSEAVAELRGLSRAMSELPAVMAPRSFALREADIAGAKTPAPSSLFGSVQPLLSGVAAIAIVAFIVLAGFDLGSDSSQGVNSDTASGAAATASLELSETVPSTFGEGDAAPTESFRADEGMVDVDSDLAFASVDDPEIPGGAVPVEEKADEPPIVDSTQGDGERSHAAPLTGDTGSSTGLRVAESVAAAVAIAAGGSVLLIWWRRRATTG